MITRKIWDFRHRDGDCVAGWTLRMEGAVSLLGMSPEMAAQIAPEWELTDRRPGSATEALTVYVRAGATDAEMGQAIQRKTAEAQRRRELEAA